jgi:hypothetical protein
MKKSCQVCRRNAKTSSGFGERPMIKVRLYRIRVEIVGNYQNIFVCSKCLQSQQLNDRTISVYPDRVANIPASPTGV